MQNRKSTLLQLIDEKLAEAKATKTAKPTQSPSTRAASNRANARKSTGPKSPAGKQRAAANSLKHGFFSSVEKLNPRDAPAYQSTLADLRIGLQPDGPVEEQLLRELAMFTTRLQRLEAAEYALLAGNIEGDPPELTGESVVSDQKQKLTGESVVSDQKQKLAGESVVSDQKQKLTGESVVSDQEIDAREIALAFQKCAADLEALHKIEIHLRRAYNRTWDRLQSIQKERHKLPLDESLKRSQVWLTYEAQRTNRPEDIPARHPELNEKGKFPNYPKDHPLYRPKPDHDAPETTYDFHDDDPDWKDIHPK